jgi:hypothetical protein
MFMELYNKSKLFAFSVFVQQYFKKVVRKENEFLAEVGLV